MANFDEDFGTWASAAAIAILVAGALYAGTLYFGNRPTEIAAVFPIERLVPNGVPVPR